MSLITVSNHGPLIAATNFWGSEYTRAGKIFCSCNAGAIRILIPQQHNAIVNEMRSSKYVICSRGPWPAEGKTDAVELLFEDGSDSPFVLHLSPESFDALPAEPEGGGEWIVSVWTERKGVPHKSLERHCHWRRVDKLPCMEPWQ